MNRSTAGELADAQERRPAAAAAGLPSSIGLGGFSTPVAVAWAGVLLPIAWGVYMTVTKVAELFS